MTVEKYIENLIKERKTILLYLVSKFHAEDWPGVANAAMDLRDIDSALSALKIFQDNKEAKVYEWEQSSKSSL